jgi:ribosomal protein L24
VVQVAFPESGYVLAYYNDKFDLHYGDRVYVDGKLEGQLGRVVEVNYNFKIKLSDYHRVIAVVDTNVQGQFFLVKHGFITFDPSALPYSKVRSWFKAPEKEDVEIVVGNDDTAFPLADLDMMPVSPMIRERGIQYFMEDRVKYICLDGTHGHAIVEGGEPYEVEFEFQNGQISNLICSCFCCYNCKHEVAVMLQLRETIELILNYYDDEYERSDYFVAINQETLFEYAIHGREKQLAEQKFGFIFGRNNA